MSSKTKIHGGQATKRAMMIGAIPVTLAVSCAGMANATPTTPHYQSAQAMRAAQQAQPGVIPANLPFAVQLDQSAGTLRQTVTRAGQSIGITPQTIHDLVASTSGHQAPALTRRAVDTVAAPIRQAHTDLAGVAGAVGVAPDRVGRDATGALIGAAIGGGLGAVGGGAVGAVGGALAGGAVGAVVGTAIGTVVGVVAVPVGAAVLTAALANTAGTIMSIPTGGAAEIPIAAGSAVWALGDAILAAPMGAGVGALAGGVIGAGIGAVAGGALGGLAGAAAVGIPAAIAGGVVGGIIADVTAPHPRGPVARTVSANLPVHAAAHHRR